MESYHQFAWQGFSCDIPADWNLAEYKIVGGVSYARFHDDFNRRLDIEWIKARRKMKMEVIRRRYDQIASSMNTAGAQVENIEDLPGGWSACFYSMPDGKRLMAAFKLVPESVAPCGGPPHTNRVFAEPCDLSSVATRAKEEAAGVKPMPTQAGLAKKGSFFCLLKIYFEQASRREADRIIRRIAETFRLYEEGLVPWSVYDISFQLQSDFKLSATAFQAGRKMMIFEWRLRRLYLMFFSLADMLAKNQSREKWCADYLNTFKGISGVKFSAGGAGEIVALHNWWRFIGNVEPVTRGCLRYKAWCRPIPDKNQLFLGVFNYRRADDLSFLAAGLDPALAPGLT